MEDVLMSIIGVIFVLYVALIFAGVISGMITAFVSAFFSPKSIIDKKKNWYLTWAIVSFFCSIFTFFYPWGESEDNTAIFYLLAIAFAIIGAVCLCILRIIKRIISETKTADSRIEAYINKYGTTSFEKFYEYCKTAAEFEKSIKLKFFNPYTDELMKYNQWKSEKNRIKYNKRIRFKEFILPYYYSCGCEHYKTSIKQLVYPPEPCPVFSRSDLRKHLSAYQGFFESINDYTCLNEAKSTETTYTKKETVKKAKKMITDAESNVLDQAIKEGIIRCISLNNDNTLYESQIVPEKERYAEGETLEID